MHHVTIKGQLYIAGCPEDGLPAVHYRQKHGIPPKPTNIFEIDLSVEAPDIVNKFPAWANSSADLLFLYYDYSYRATPIPHRTEIPPHLAAQSQSDPGWLDAVVTLITDAIQAERMEKQQAEARREAERIAEKIATAERNSRDAADARVATDVLRPWMTPEELFLHSRARLDSRDVTRRLTAGVLKDLTAKLAQCPLPDGYATIEVTEDKPPTYCRGHWEADWVATLRYIESITGHPVHEVYTDCIDFYSQVTVPWQAEPVPLRLRTETAAEETVDADD